PATPHPIVNRYGCPENGGWLPLERRPDPTRPGGEYIVFTNIDIVTNTARRFRYPPPPDHLRSDFQFPGIYFMNVRLESWGSIENGVYRNRGGYSPWSLFDDIVINDFGVLDPPPPSNLSVEAGPQPPSTAQPFLNVNFYIPAGAILTYLETMYPMETQITTNLYIGQFEEAISEIFFPMPLPPAQQIRQPLSPDLRGTASSVEIAFEDLQPEFIDGRMEIDITDFQALLRGESGGSGVLRITNIPIFYSSLAITDPEPLGTIVNYNVAGSAFPNRYDSFERTYEILNNRQDFPIRLRLTGAEENVAYFLFADMEIEKFVEIDDELVLRPEIPPYQRNPAISDLTGVVSDTTVGTPQAPGPGEIAPSAPQNIGVRDVTQMGATVYWDPYPLTPAEVEDENISIEWEIIRIQDGIRLTDEQMNARDPNFMRVFNSLTTAQGHRKGWITDVDSITVFPDNEVHEEPDEYYEYNRRIVELTDMTLLPNNMYFYYVRTVRIETAWDDQLGDYVLIRNVSVWVEVSVTTSPVEPPTNLRQEDPGNHAGFDPETMVRVSWEHTIMSQIIDGGGETFLFQYQIRESDDSWGEYNVMPVSVMTEAWLDAFNANRIHYIVFGLEHGTVYEMRVRLYDVTSGDRSLWSNTIIFMTDVNQDDAHLEREVEDWLRYLRRRLEELLRNPFWISERTPNNLTVVYRPDAVFEGFMLDNAGTALPLHNTGVNNVVYYLPLSIILTANENRRGFETSFRDMQLLFAPSFLSDAHNQALIDVIREVEARGSSLTDSFARIEIDREVVDPDAAVPSINGVPAITLSTQIRAEMVATNNNIRNIRSWDRTMQINAERIVEDWLSDPVISENIRQQLMNYLSNEEMSDYIYHVVDRVVADIIREAGGFITHDDGGILSDTRFEITGFNASTHVIATPPREEYSVNGYEFINNNWQPRDLVEYHNGRAIITRTPGRFAFTGREIIIPYIEVTPRGGVIVSIVARYSLEDLFGVYVDLEQNANRQMVVGAVSRMAGVPRNANAMNWAVANLNVQLTSRNATGLISRQEAIAIVMALYEHRTNTQVNSIRIHNHQNTAGMNLDQRYAQAVRAAFEIGIISDTSFNPAGHITIGEFLDMLSILSARVRV
ncbi:MAG: fibronectin type III domain-containing protein, partial [Defluviitaleaceae bacterium]|nr:fibronectin type III domain-containing protein [Defluviitaleaceae bacterium]